jgi:outer membrane protein insertion porin family
MGNEKREMKNKSWLIIKKLLFIFSVFLMSYLSFFTYIHASNSSELIKAIEVKGLTRIDREELIDLICFGVGDTLDREELNIGIRRAFKKGIFHDIKVVLEPYNGGIRLTYHIKEIPLVDSITVDGNKNFSRRKIKKIFYFKEGDNFKEEFLAKAREDLLEFYKRKGFPDAKIAITVKDTEKAAMVDINVNIEEGNPLIIKKIKVSADAGNVITLKEGDIFDKDELDKNIGKLKDHYKSENYIKPILGPYQFESGELIIPVHRGPKLELIFRNNAAVKAKKLKQEAPFIENEEVTDETVAETVDRIKRLYAGKGYYYVQVAAAVERAEDIIKVNFIIFEGKKVVLRNMNFTGISISPEAVKRVISLTEDEPFNNNLLNSSKESLVRFYNALGYLRMDIVDIRKEFQNDGRDLNLEFVINEGTQTKIKSIGIVGNRKISASQIRNVIKLKEESLYNVVDIGDARRRVLSLYGRRGYLDTSVEVESVIDKDNAFLTFKITEKKPSVIGKIILSGNHRTRPKIINREITLKEGELYNREEITKIRQRLYKLGIFNEVSIDILDHGNKGNDELVRDMLVSLKEGNAGSVEVSAGFGDYEKLRGSVDISYRNLGGYNRQVGFRAELSSVEKRYLLNFKEPWLFNKPNVPLKIFLLNEETRSINIETRDILYKIDRLSFIAGVEKEMIEGLKVGFDYEYSYVDTKDVEPGIILSKEDTGTIGISSISPSIFYDTRDNPFDPAAGSLQGFVLKYASEAFLSETEFIKVSLQSSWFLRIIKGVVFAFSLKGGAAYGFGETEEIPLIERFFLGGRSTVRGYSHDTLGPKGEDDNATGGNVFALTNWELRFSLGKGFSLVTFIDSGNVWRTADEVEASLKYTAGPGLRYNTPVGPIRIDYGHKMNKEPGDSSGEVHFSFGHAF